MVTLASNLDIDIIMSCFSLRMGYGALTMVKESKFLNILLSLLGLKNIEPTHNSYIRVLCKSLSGMHAPYLGFMHYKRVLRHKHGQRRNNDLNP